MIARFLLAWLVPLVGCVDRIDHGTSMMGSGDGGTGDAQSGACTVAACPAGYQVMNGGCYKVVGAPRPWLDAQAACAADGAHLVVEADFDEHYLIGQLGSTAGFERFWIGWTDRRGPDNVFTWIVPAAGSEALQGNSCVFGSGEPDAGDADHCVYQYGYDNCSSGDCDDDNCAEALPSICECSGMLADPTTF